MTTTKPIQPATPLPQVGKIVKVHGKDCRIVKVHQFGTIDAVSLDGSRVWRLSGLGF